jgi:hypothetical protein
VTPEDAIDEIRSIGCTLEGRLDWVKVGGTPEQAAAGRVIATLTRASLRYQRSFRICIDKLRYLGEVEAKPATRSFIELQVSRLEELAGSLPKTAPRDRKPAKLPPK